MAQEHQEYIQTKVNPVLESLVTQVLLERPDDPVPFMIKWLADQAKTTGTSVNKKNEASDLEKLKETLGVLQQSVKDLESRVGEAATKCGDEGEEEEEEDEDEDDDDDDVDDLPPPPKNFGAPRASVSAEAYGDWNKKKEFIPPVIPKEEEAKDRIKVILARSFLFQALDDKEIGTVVDAMAEVVCEPNFRIINQGEDGDALYVIEAGELECYIKKKDVPDEIMVKRCVVGDAFGELALLYNCPRAASVQSVGDSVLWKLDRETFNNVVKEAAMRKREMYEKFLATVPLLESVDTYERMQVADALKSETYNNGDFVVKQGDEGEKFFLIENGTCIATKQFNEGEEAKEVMQYKAGDYFGELALLRGEPRAANIVATSDVKVSVLDRKTFKRLLGPLEDILKRNEEKYNTVMNK